MHNMGDILGDDAAFCRKFGMEANHETIGPVYALMEKVSNTEVDNQIAEDRKNFKIDPGLPVESHRYAARMQIGFEKFLVANNYNGFPRFFNIYKEDRCAAAPPPAPLWPLPTRPESRFPAFRPGG
jgi:L-arabinose isomerase